MGDYGTVSGTATYNAVFLNRAVPFSAVLSLNGASSIARHGMVHATTHTLPSPPQRLLLPVKDRIHRRENKKNK